MQSEPNALTHAYNFITSVSDTFRERVSFDLGIPPETYMRLAKEQQDRGYNILDRHTKEVVIDNLKRVIREARRTLQQVKDTI